jgi:hypothetical protein
MVLLPHEMIHSKFPLAEPVFAGGMVCIGVNTYWQEIEYGFKRGTRRKVKAKVKRWNWSTEVLSADFDYKRLGWTNAVGLAYKDAARRMSDGTV